MLLSQSSEFLERGSFWISWGMGKSGCSRTSVGAAVAPCAWSVRDVREGHREPAFTKRPFSHLLTRLLNLATCQLLGTGALASASRAPR